MVVALTDAPPGLVAVYGDPENELEQYELPILKLALADTGELTGIVWCQKHQRFVIDCTDPVFFKDFIRVEMADDDLDEGDDDELED